jgi:protein phosphatase
MLQIEFAQLSDVGKIRDHNEDFMGNAIPAASALERSQGWLFVVADGVGGQQKGEVASRVAVETMVHAFQQNANGESHSALLPRLVQRANKEILEASLAGGGDSAGMATTLVACALRFDRATVAHVGDSRCYLVRAGKAALLTRDHTVANEQVRLGLVSRQEAAEGAASHMLMRSLGSELVVNVDVDDHQIYPGDVLLLCSDGLHGSIDLSDIASLCGHGQELNIAAKQLVGLANERDGSDNISVQVIRIRDVERMGMYRGRPYKLH